MNIFNLLQNDVKSYIHLLLHHPQKKFLSSLAL